MLGTSYLERLPGRLVKLGEGHYRVVFDDKTQRMGVSGRKPGRKQPVPEKKQVAGKCYCTECNRPLNINNTTSLCRTCVQPLKRVT